VTAKEKRSVILTLAILIIFLVSEIPRQLLTHKNIDEEI
jgi:hypothetical protein